MPGIYACRIGPHAGSEAATRLLRHAFHLAYPEAPIPLRAAGKGGKPYLPGYPNFHFSLSHSGDWAVCAVGDYPLGVDIEALRPVRPGIPERYFSPAECTLLKGLEKDAFFTFWTLKEASVKATGEGLARGLAHTEVTLAPSPTIVTESFRAFPIPFSDKKYRLSLCLSRADTTWTKDDLEVIIV